MVIHHAHFILYVHDQSASMEFYRRVLATEPVLDVPGMTEFALGDGAILGLMPESGIVRLLGGGVVPGGPEVSRAELYLLVDDPGAVHTRALAAGAVELSPPARRDWGADVAYSRDPDGHVIGVAGTAPERSE